MNQLILPYQKNVKKKFDSFFCDNEKNDQIIEIIKNIFDNKNNQIYIWADKSFGKSHLLYAACNYFGEKNKKCVYLPLTDNKKFKPDILDGFENYDLVCIDDIDLIFQKKDWEFNFFVLINKILDKTIIKKACCRQNQIAQVKVPIVATNCYDHVRNGLLCLLLILIPQLLHMRNREMVVIVIVVHPRRGRR